MKTKLELGKSVSSFMDSSIYDSLYKPLYSSLSCSSNYEAWKPVISSVWNSIEDSMRWDIEL